MQVLPVLLMARTRPQLAEPAYLPGIRSALSVSRGPKSWRSRSLSTHPESINATTAVRSALGNTAISKPTAVPSLLSAAMST